MIREEEENSACLFNFQKDKRYLRLKSSQLTQLK